MRSIYTIAVIAIGFFAVSIIAGCKKKESPYVKFDLQKIRGSHTWHSRYDYYYHNSSYQFDSVYARPDTTFPIDVADQRTAYIGNIKLLIQDPYTTSSIVILSNDTTGHEAKQKYRQMVLYYNYEVHSLTLVDGTYSNSAGDDDVYTYTTEGF